MKKCTIIISILLIFTSGLYSQVIFNYPFTENFENDPLWTIIDGDQLPPGEYLTQSGTIWVDPSWRYSSSWSCAMSNSRFVTPGKADNWMIIPQLSLPTNIPYIKWQGRNVNQSNGKEDYEILISNTNNDTVSFTKLTSITENSTSYSEYALELSDYAGQDVYLAFRHVTYDAYLLCIDAIEVGGTENYDLALIKSSVPEVVLAPSLISVSDVEILNRGKETVNSFDLNWKLNDGTVFTESYTNMNLDPFIGSVTLTHPDKPEITNVDQYLLKVWSSNINGYDDEYPSNDTLTYHIGGISLIPEKHVIVEEGTGTWCSYCTDGAWRVTDILETVQNTIGIAVHSGDVMSNPDGDTLLAHYFAALPRGAIDRVKYQEYEDVGFSRGDWKVKAIQRTSDIVPAEVEVNPVFDYETRELTVEISAKFFGVFSKPYRLSAIIVEDSVTGGSEYDQANYYNNEPGHPFYGLGNPIVGYVHNHVLRKIMGGTWGLEGIVPDTTADLEEYSHSFSYVLPEEWNEDHIKVVGVLQNYSDDVNDRSIVNSKYSEIDTYVGLHNSFTEKRISIYPNPASQKITIEANSSIDRIDMYNYVGQLVEQSTINNTELDMDISGFEAGIYIIRVYTENIMITKKLVIK